MGSRLGRTARQTGARTARLACLALIPFAVGGSPAHALLEVAGSDPRNLIVVGNRGLGAEAGDALGSVPREVVKNAVCNVMVVQTGAEGNQRSEGIVHTPGRGG